MSLNGFQQKSIMFMLFGNELRFHDDIRADGNVMKSRILGDEVDLKNTVFLITSPNHIFILRDHTDFMLGCMKKR